MLVCVAGGKAGGDVEMGADEIRRWVDGMLFMRLRKEQGGPLQPLCPLPLPSPKMPARHGRNRSEFIFSSHLRATSCRQPFLPPAPCLALFFLSLSLRECKAKLFRLPEPSTTQSLPEVLFVP